MYKKEKLIKKLYQTLNIMSCEAKIARNYGTDHKLTYSDISLLKCIQNNENTKASELSQYLGMTNGAVAQFAKKLEAKGYLEPYRIDGNKKEVYYKLTDSGEAACRGCDEHYKKLMKGIEDYISQLDEDTVKKIGGLFDLIAVNAAVEQHCSIKHTAGKDEPQSDNDSQGEVIRRCEKCQRIY
ncbi:phenylalanine--tRNA ligase alpha subunit [Oxobacter pfennigii]|uniref:Phenylalanine--tRNA ligase alpha subunit n=1 Tax=Oxobacter pfennigii TaxID=36849 RepID=A0A0P8WLA3_9CLOT|nr:MarR family transcriptional regulator [Oxobacter pfennigii]KPU43171.1 phenylalanine--tRNA ligase alpha subunit [Oxobacter pfennigii]